ncbi:hypothetical protein SEVIR_9G492275v4 [Setaria viridis]
MLPARRAVARTQSTAAPPVAQPSSRHPGRGHVRHSGRVRFFTPRLNLPARHHRTTVRFVTSFPRSRASASCSSRSHKVHEPLLRGGIGRGRARAVSCSRRRGIRLRPHGARPGPSGKAPTLQGPASSGLRPSLARPTGPVPRAQFDADGRARASRRAGAHRCLGHAWAGRAGHGSRP